jgi:hypothetical protein
VVVLDMTFQTRDDASSAKQASTQELAGAISAVRGGVAKPGRSGELNTAVVVGVRDLLDGRPNVEPVLRQALEQPGAGLAPGYLGVTCGGFEGGFATTFPVIVSPMGRQEPLKSLALAAILAEARAEIRPWEVGDNRLELSGQVRPLPLSGWGEARRTPNDCSIINEGDQVAKVIIDQSFAQNPWQNAVVPFEDAVLGKLDAFKKQINQRICLIGADLRGKDQHRAFWGSTDVPGVKLQADAISSLWNRVALRRLPPFVQLPLMLVLGSFAALSRFLIPPQRWKLRAATLSALIALDVTFAVISAVYFDLFMDAEYHVLAVLMSHWYAQRLEGRFIAMPRLEQGRAE